MQVPDETAVQQLMEATAETRRALLDRVYLHNRCALHVPCTACWCILTSPADCRAGLRRRSAGCVDAHADRQLHVWQGMSAGHGNGH